MTILSLKNRLNKKLADYSVDEALHKKFVKPQKLIKTLDDLEQIFDNLENATPLDEKIFKAFLRFDEFGVKQFTRRDWKNLAWSLSRKLPTTEGKIIFSNSGREIVNLFLNADPSIIKIVYFPLLYSYFSLTGEDVKSKPTVWIDLRKILNHSKNIIYNDVKQPKKWMKTLKAHSEILSNTPTNSFVKIFLEDSDIYNVQKSLESLRIESNSWFWDDLIKSSIHSISTMSESEYLHILPRFIELAKTKKLYSLQIIKALLEKYERTSLRSKVHEDLQYLALNEWGNPQYDSSAGWNNVNIQTKRMVIQWFVRADLEAFFRLFSDSADTNRFNYWIKFINKISFSQIFLGPTAHKSLQPQHKEFRKLNKGRLKELVGSTQSNNAFLLKIDNIYVVDFSDTGNACYSYKELPYKHIIPRVHISDLKNKNTVLFRSEWGEQVALSHAGNWQARFDEKLAELGIFGN